MSGAPDVAVVGGGIVGCALAAFLAEGGAAVTLYEREAIAAGASGRNSGVVQHPLDAALVGLYEESLEHYAALGRGFELPADPVGLLLVAEPERLGPAPEGFPELRPTRLEGAALRAAEPALADGLAAWRLETGRPVPPAAAATAFAARARDAGARIEVGAEARVADGGGVIVGGELRPAGVVALAAGPWTPDAAGRPTGPSGAASRPGASSGAASRPAGSPDAASRPLPIEAQWGVVVELEIPGAPTHVLEEAGIEALTSAGGAPQALFSAVTARGISAIGSTFTRERPDAEAIAPIVLEHASRFLPAIERARRLGLRACARPRSHDGRPLLGWLDERVAVASGHGAWGITLGPASARLVADLILGRPVEIPRAFAPDRG